MENEKPNKRWSTDYRKKMAEIRRIKVATYYKRGYSYSQIAKLLTNELQPDVPIVKSTICHDVQLLLKEWRQEKNMNMDDAIQLELSRIDEIIRECWEAWEKSKKDYQEKSIARKGVPTKSDESESESVKTLAVFNSIKDVTRYGDVRYLDMIHKQLQERRKILGIYAPEKRELTGKDGEDLYKGMSEQELEAKLKETLNKLNL